MSDLSRIIEESSDNDIFRSFRINVLGRYPVGSDYMLTLYSGSLADKVVVFDGTSKDIAIKESGRIDVVEVTNSSENYILLIHGSIVFGASQDRIIRMPIIIPTTKEDTPYRISSYCVESGQGLMRSFFSGSIIAPLDFRVEALSMHTSQGDLWNKIGRYIEKTARYTGLPRDFVHKICATNGLTRATMLGLVANNKNIKRSITAMRSLSAMLRESLSQISEKIRNTSKTIRSSEIENYRKFDQWLMMIINICDYGIEKFRDDERFRFVYLTDFYGLIHAQNHPKKEYMEPFEKVRFESILRGIISIISKYSGVSAETILDHLTAPKGHYPLARLTTNMHRMLDMIKEVRSLVERYLDKRNIDEVEEAIGNIKKEYEGISNQIFEHLRTIRQLLSELYALESKLMEKVMKIREKICTPEAFGIKYREDIIGYSLSRNGEPICIEIFPSHISRRLFVGLFQSMLLYIMYHEGGKRKETEPKTTTERLLDKYMLTISETKDRIQAKITEKEAIIYYFEATFRS